jgi:hypothetical protein
MDGKTEVLFPAPARAHVPAEIGGYLLPGLKDFVGAHHSALGRTCDLMNINYS